MHQSRQWLTALLGWSLLASTCPLMIHPAEAQTATAVQTTTAATPALSSLEPDTVDNQIILGFNGPVQANLIPTYHNQQRALLIDIKGATIGSLPNREAVLSQLKEKLPLIKTIQLSEFKGDVPVVRFFIEPKSTATTGKLTLTNGNTQIALKFLSTGHSLANVETAPIMEPITPMALAPLPNQPKGSQSLGEVLVNTTTQPANDIDLKPVPLKTDAPSAVASNPAPKNRFFGSASAGVSDSAYNKEVNQAESLRRERDQLEDNVRTLKELLAQQHQQIAHLKSQQQELLLKDRDTHRKELLTRLETELNHTNKSYEQLQRDFELIKSENNQLKDQLEQAKNDVKAADATLKTNQPTDWTSYRAELVPSLTKMTQVEIDQVVNAEKAYQKYLSLTEEGMTDKARSLLSAAHKTAPQVPQYAIALANELVQSGKKEEAQTVLESALKYQPDHLLIKQELGKLAYLNQDYTKARSWFQQAMPTNLLNNYASILRRFDNDHLDRAELLYKVAIDANPKDSDLYYNLGTLYLSQKRYGDAKDYFKQAILLNPTFAEAHYQLGLTFAHSGQNPLAVNAFQKYLELAPTAANKADVEQYMMELSRGHYAVSHGLR